MYRHNIHHRVYKFPNLKTLLGKASPYRSGDELAGLCAAGYEERMAAQITLADVPLKNFLNEVVIPYEDDEITPLKDAMKIKEQNLPNIEFIITKGLGHRKIYGDLQIKNRIVEFL